MLKGNPGNYPLISVCRYIPDWTPKATARLRFYASRPRGWCYQRENRNIDDKRFTSAQPKAYNSRTLQESEWSFGVKNIAQMLSFYMEAPWENTWVIYIKNCKITVNVNIPIIGSTL